MIQEEHTVRGEQEDKIQLIPMIFIISVIISAVIGTLASTVLDRDLTVEFVLGGACVGLLIIVQLLFKENKELREENADLRRKIKGLADATRLISQL